MSELSLSAFSGLDAEFDTTFVKENSLVIAEQREIMELQEEMNAIELKTNEIKNMVKIEDAGYLSKEIKSMIKSARSVLDRLDGDIRIGCKASMYEAYASMFNSVMSSIKELRQLNVDIVTANIIQKKKTLGNMEKDDKISLTAEQLLDMVIGAKANSEMNSINVDFEVEDLEEDGGVGGFGKNVGRDDD